MKKAVSRRGNCMKSFKAENAPQESREWDKRHGTMTEAA
jgi:hypothetical protein